MSTTPGPLRIAVVGDVHLRWDARDVAVLDRAGYDLVLFVGDLAAYRERGGQKVARAIAPLRTPALVLPGNHDGVTLPQLAAETFETPGPVRDGLCVGMATRCAQLSRALGSVPLVGYSLHRVGSAESMVSVLAGRPHSMGGPRLAFRRHLAAAYGVDTMGASATKLCALVDEVGAEPLVFLGHNGPSGLGEQRDDIYGRDFHPDQGDWGDADLETAIRYAREHGKRVAAVISGHMHHHLKGGGARRWAVERDGVHYINAARVPRHRRGPSGEEAHHVRLTLDGAQVTVEEVWAPLE